MTFTHPTSPATPSAVRLWGWGPVITWVAMPSLRGSSRPRDRTRVFYVSCLGRQVLYCWCHLMLLVTQSCPALCNPTNCSPPVSSVHGILQARIPEWVAISSQSRDQTHVACFSCIDKQILFHYATWEVLVLIPLL